MSDEIKEAVKEVLAKQALPDEINVPQEYVGRFVLVSTQIGNLQLQMRLLFSELEKKFKIYDEDYQLSQDFTKLVKVNKPAPLPPPNPFEKKE